MGSHGRFGASAVRKRTLPRFPEISRMTWHIGSTPLIGIHPLCNVPMICRPRPRRNPINHPMLHRVVMNIIHMLFKIMVVAYPVLPEPSLPDRPFAPARPRFGHHLIQIKSRSASSRHMLLDLCPPEAEIPVSRRQRPDTMQMVGKKDPRVDGKRKNAPDPLDPLTQSPADRLFAQNRTAPVGNHGKKIGGTSGLLASIIGHVPPPFF